MSVCIIYLIPSSSCSFSNLEFSHYFFHRQHTYSIWTAPSYVLSLVQLVSHVTSSTRYPKVSFRPKVLLPSINHVKSRNDIDRLLLVH